MTAIGSMCGTATIAGCIGGNETNEQDIKESNNTENSNSTSNEKSSLNDEEVENCRTEVESHNEYLVDQSRKLDGGADWTEKYRYENNDTVHFDISTSVGQDVAVEIDSPQGQTVYSETGLSLATTHQFSSGGEGEVRIANFGEKTEEETKEVWENRVSVSAGNQLDPWIEIEEGDRIDYYIRMVDGARPNLRIEDSSGNIHRKHAVSEIIDDEFIAPKDDRYYFFMENTATFTAGVWDYTFEHVEEVPIPTTVELIVEREYEEEVEICD